MSGAELVLTLLGLVAVGSAVLVVTTTRIVHAALWLVVTLGAVAGCYLLLVAEFVAWVQVLIYVGAVVVLLLFGLMLTRAPIGSSTDAHRPQPRVALGVAVGARGGAPHHRPPGLVIRVAIELERHPGDGRDGDGRGDLPHLGAAVRGALGAAARRTRRRDRALPRERPEERADARWLMPLVARRAALLHRGRTACWPGATRSSC